MSNADHSSRPSDQLEAELARKEELLKEIHHRVKNSLQVIASLINLQARRVADERVLAVLGQTLNRIQSIATIYELLCQSDSLAAIDLTAYARQLVPELVRFYAVENRVHVQIDGGDVMLEIDRAVPYGLLLNELVSNACKHAFAGDRCGDLTVRLSHENDQILLTVADNGIGLPSSFDHLQSSSLGFELIHTLARQLGGTIAVHTIPGTTVELRIPQTIARSGENG